MFQEEEWQQLLLDRVEWAIGFSNMEIIYAFVIFSRFFYCNADGNLIGECSRQKGKMGEIRDNYGKILQESFDLRKERIIR